MELEKICVWYLSSTNPKTFELENPIYCKECNGKNYQCPNYTEKEDLNKDGEDGR